MNVFHKILIILLFFVAVASVVMGYMLFDQREVLKERLLVHEAHAERLADELDWGEFEKFKLGNPSLVNLPERFGGWSTESEYKSKGDNSKRSLALRNIQDYQRLDDGLRDMELVARDRVASLIENKKQWDTMDRRLSETNGVLSDTKIDLANTRQELADEQDAHSDTKDSLARAEAKIADLDGQIIALKGNIDKLDEQLQMKGQEIAKLNVELDGCFAEALECEEQLLICRSNKGGTTDAEEDIIANVVAVEEEWNFVVINVGNANAPVRENSVAMVHREDELIGKIHITKVGDTTAIGQILGDWNTQGVKIRPGDGVMF